MTDEKTTATIVVTDDSFTDDVLSSEQPVLVDFWATWCGPCKMVAPVLEEIAKEKAGQLTVAKLGVEFLTGQRHEHVPDRALATVLFTDIVDSTRRAAELGDERWRELLERHDEITRVEIARFHGRVVKHTGDGFRHCQLEQSEGDFRRFASAIHQVACDV